MPTGAALKIPAMPEIISFPQRMRFQAIRSFDVRTGTGGVVAVLWAPLHSERQKENHRQKHQNHPALAELLPNEVQAVMLVPANPTEASYGDA